MSKKVPTVYDKVLGGKLEPKLIDLSTNEEIDILETIKDLNQLLMDGKVSSKSIREKSYPFALAAVSIVMQECLRDSKTYYMAISNPYILDTLIQLVLFGYHFHSLIQKRKWELQSTLTPMPSDEIDKVIRLTDVENTLIQAAMDDKLFDEVVKTLIAEGKLTIEDLEKLFPNDKELLEKLKGVISEGN